MFQKQAQSITQNSIHNPKSKLSEIFKIPKHNKKFSKWEKKKKKKHKLKYG